MTGSVNGRRQFLGGLLAAGLVPKPTWGDAGSPVFLSAGLRKDGRFVLCGIGADLRVRFELPLPARGHAAAAHPSRPEAVAFARRPGIFAVVIDCMTGRQKATLNAPEGRHFYGHGVFSVDGTLLFTTENDYEAGQGRIGVWDVMRGYKRVAEWESGGIGPHDIKRLPYSDTLIVANGGIDTHPDSGRAKLNVPDMRPKLTYLEDGEVLEQVELPAALHKNSIRHLAVGREGQVAFGMQWQGGGPVETLVGIHERGSGLRLTTANFDDMRMMDGYVGSIAFSADGEQIAVTSPRGGQLQIFETHTGFLLDAVALPDVCGVAAVGQDFILTSGTGSIMRGQASELHSRKMTDVQWDNHLVSIAGA